MDLSSLKESNETIFSVVKFTTLHLLFAIVTMENLELYQINAKTAFLTGDLIEDVFRTSQRAL